MGRGSVWMLSSVVAIASSLIATGAIAHPAPSPSLPTHLPLNRLSRDLIPSASEDFFNRGRVRLERELQQLATNRQTLDDLLKVTPDPRPLPKEIEQNNNRVKGERVDE